METWKIYIKVSCTHTAINVPGENVIPLDLCLLVDDWTRSESLEEGDSEPECRQRSYITSNRCLLLLNVQERANCIPKVREWVIVNRDSVVDMLERRRYAMTLQHTTLTNKPHPNYGPYMG
jgi:hypothetical protein